MVEGEWRKMPCSAQEAWNARAYVGGTIGPPDLMAESGTRPGVPWRHDKLTAKTAPEASISWYCAERLPNKGSRRCLDVNSAAVSCAASGDEYVRLSAVARMR